MKRLGQDTFNIGNKRTGIKIDINDGASSWLGWAAKNFPDFTRSALKSAGWWLSQKIKKEMREGAPAGRKYAPRMPAGRRRRLESVWSRGKFGGEVKSRYPWFGKLPRGIGYELAGDETVLVGPLTSSAGTLMLMHELGYTRMVTRKMRKGFFAAGVGLKQNRRFITGPARPTINPIFEKYGPQIHQYIEEKIWGYMKGNTERSVPSSRKAYKVLTGGPFKAWF